MKKKKMTALQNEVIGSRLTAPCLSVVFSAAGLSERPMMASYQLSANENPYPPLPSVEQLLGTEAGHVNRYPDRRVSTLTGALAGRLAVPAAHIATGAGSVGVTHHLMQSVFRDGGEAVYAWPSFEAYPHLSGISGARPVPVPLRDERHDLPAMADAISDRTKLVIVCNPNNPTGTAVRHAELETFLDRVPEGVLVLLDEAYREFVRDPQVPDGVELYRNRPNVVVLRTFSKAYGLAGLRIGYAVAHEPVAARIRETAVPFGVNSLAQSAAVASLLAERELMDRVETIVKERDRVAGELLGLGLPAPAAATQANFVWLRLGERTTAFAEACSTAGVTVRAFPGEGARVTIGEPEANDIVLRIAAEYVPQAG
ncbi:histidinol-phosphate transaminase [Streptomyces sp. NPDC059168]|uniref:histidinol-phosphate transaminase n=1 Tax=Streptomyces sp. NPDC059168 TaxID=3346753 RepID=UPI0036B1652A